MPPVHISIEDGKWHGKQDADGSRVFHFRQDDGTIEELMIPANVLAYIHTVKRTVQPEPKNPADQ